MERSGFDDGEHIPYFDSSDPHHVDPGDNGEVDSHDVGQEGAAEAYVDHGIIRDPESMGGYDYDAPDNEIPYEQIAALRCDAIMERVGMLNDETGVDVGRVHHFARALGIGPFGKHLIVHEANLPEVNEALAEQGMHGLSGHEGGDGTYYSSLGLSVLAFPDDVPREYVEKSVMHEYAHASVGVAENINDEPYDEIASPVELGDPVRIGFYDTYGEGLLFEEAFGHWLDAEYAKYTGLDISRFDFFEEAPVGSPQKYPYEDAYSQAAMMLEVLFHQDEALIDIAFAARQNPEAYDEMMARINRIQPWLADALYMIPRAPYDTEGLTTYELFDDALGLVLEATGVRREQLAEICDNGSATNYIARKLEAYEAETDYHFMR